MRRDRPAGFLAPLPLALAEPSPMQADYSPLGLAHLWRTDRDSQVRHQPAMGAPGAAYGSGRREKPSGLALSNRPRPLRRNGV